MSAFETACPDCGAAFEVDEEYRGQQADCPGCGCLFLIPQTGKVGTKISAESLFAVSCPKCGAAFDVPNEYRGEQADCTSCGTPFIIPETGDKGVPVSVGAAAPAAAAAPRPGAPSAPKASAAAAGPQKTTSGIQAGTSADAAYKKSGTVRLSRAAILENVMKPQLKDETEKKGASPKAPAAGGAPAAPAAGGMAAKPRVPPPAPSRPLSRPPTPAHAAPHAPAPAGDEGEGEEEAAAPAKERKPAKKVTLPGWAPDLRLGKRETVLDYKSGGGASLGSHRTLTLLPVILVPVAVLVTGALGAILSALAFTAIGGIVWAIYAFVMLPGVNRRGLVVTTRRAILIEEDKISDIEISE